MKAMAKRLPEFQDCMELERFTGGDYCGCRGLLAYASNQSGGIVLKNLNTGAEEMISASGKGAGSPRFSPDGKNLLFLESGLFCWDLDSRELRRLSDFSGPVSEPMWSPDGKHILFSSTQGTAPAPKKRPDEPIVIEDFGYKFDGAGYIRPDGHTHLFVLDVESGTVTQLTQGLHDELHHTWTPDGRIVYVGNENRPKEQSIGYDLYVLSLDGEKRQISQDFMIVSYPNPTRPVVTPDSQFVIMGAMNPDTDWTKGYPDVVLYQFPVAGGEAKRIFRVSETCYQCVQFPYNAGCGWGMDKVQMSPEGDWVYFLSGWKGQGVLYRLAVDGQMHTAETVLSGKQIIHGIGRIQQGKMLIAKSETNLPEAYYLLDLKTGTLEKVAQSAQTPCDEVKLTAAEDFFFDTLDGESQVHGWVLPPAEMESGKKYPTILYIHGGPHPFYTYGFTMEHQCFAGAGFGVIFCNPRGTSSYGPVHQNLKRGYDSSAYTDLLQFVDEAIRRYDWIDPERLGVTGGSYGGYMTNYIATHSQRFQAYITQRSVANDLICYASSDMQGSSKAYASFEEFMVNELKSSTVSYVERINKPFLILHGTEDYRTPVEGAHQLFVAIKDTHPDLPVKMVLFPHTNHDQPCDPRLLKQYYEEMVAWFRAYL